MDAFRTAGFLLVAVVILIGCMQSSAQTHIPEIRPGILQGYLAEGEYPNSLDLVPAPPEKGSAGDALDLAINKKARQLIETPRYELARRDAELMFPEAAATFSCALGVPVSQSQTPHLYMLLRRVLADAGLSTYAAKDAYQRPRPFMVNGLPICTPGEEEYLSKDGAYPSGHTAIGWAWALVLAEVAPDRADAVLQRGRAYGESRIVCNVHWYSDVVAGRLVGAAAVARLHGNSEFMAAVEAARKEVKEVRELGLPPSADCAFENTALKVELPLQ